VRKASLRVYKTCSCGRYLNLPALTNLHSTNLDSLSTFHHASTPGAP
jgi:hypothetical protein